MKKSLLLMLALAFAGVTFASKDPMKIAPYRGAISADASGRVLFSDHADRIAYPASVTKLMTALLVIEDIKAKRYQYSDKVTATAEARRSEPSWVDIRPGEKMSVRDLMMVLMVMSANDAAIVLGVNSAGSTEAFVARMNARAKELGMASTKYYNPNGLPPNAKRGYPWKNYNVSTAADQLKLVVELLKHPEVLEFTAVKTCDLIKTESGYRVAVTRRVNNPHVPSKLAPGEKLVRSLCSHNNVMVKDKLKIHNPDGKECVDGLKTGFIEAGGSSVVLTGTRASKRAIVVVLGSGAETDARGRVTKQGSVVRDENARRLLVDALGALDWR